MDPQSTHNPQPLDPDALSLCTLPLDLLLEIFARCEWFEVLKLRRVCRFLREISYSRSIWASLFHQHSSQHTRKLYLCTELHAASSQDFEALILQHERAHIAWTHPQPALNCWILHPTSNDTIIGLLPCGRYALAYNPCGEFICYDLQQAANPRRIRLFTYLRAGDTSSTVENACYDVDDTSPYLRFNVALAYFRVPPGQPIDTLVIEVWRCEPAFDKHGVMYGFDVSMLSRFDESALHRARDMCMSGPYLAYFTGSTSAHITVVDWVDAHGHGTNFRRRCVPCPRYGGTQFYFLPHGRILKGDNFAMNIYSFASAPITTSYTALDRPLTDEERTRYLVWSSRPATPIRSQNVLMKPRRLGDTISNCKGDPDSLCFLGYTYSHDLFALIIPKGEHWSQKETPRLIQLCRHSDPTLSLHAQVYGSSKFIGYDLTDGVQSLRLNSFELPIVMNVDSDEERDGDEDEDEEPEGGMIQAYCDVGTVLTRRSCVLRDPETSFAQFPRFFFDEASHRILAIEDFPQQLRLLILDIDVDLGALT